MNSIFDPQTRTEIISRINSLSANSQAQWGKMNVYQMLKHCTLCEEMYLGKTQHKRAFMGYIFGRIGLKNLMKDEKPIGRNAPTGQAFKVQERSGDVEAEKATWASLIAEYSNYNKEDFMHWFFGPMTKEQVGIFVYKHSDHHLRQFGA
ncbi:MAG: hypothetical protein K0S09_1484 [Sphingobacteriaceae bacterium]|jgi:hypothetical protein|nr:hypothetical protein [Sphingobacteriaceae bacterium]